MDAVIHGLLHAATHAAQHYVHQRQERKAARVAARAADPSRPSTSAADTVESAVITQLNIDWPSAIQISSEENKCASGASKCKIKNRSKVDQHTEYTYEEECYTFYAINFIQGDADVILTSDWKGQLPVIGEGGQKRLVQASLHLAHHESGKVYWGDSGWTTSTRKAPCPITVPAKSSAENSVADKRSKSEEVELSGWATVLTKYKGGRVESKRLPIVYRCLHQVTKTCHWGLASGQAA